MRAQNVSGVDRFQNTGFLFDPISAIKKFLENLFRTICRVDWKVSIVLNRFLNNFFIAEIASDYGLVRIGLRTNYRMVLSGEVKNKSKSLMSDFGELGLFEKIFKNLKNLAGP